MEPGAILHQGKQIFNIWQYMDVSGITGPERAVLTLKLDLN